MNARNDISHAQRDATDVLLEQVAALRDLTDELQIHANGIRDAGSAWDAYTRLWLALRDLTEFRMVPEALLQELDALQGQRYAEERQREQTERAVQPRLGRAHLLAQHARDRAFEQAVDARERRDQEGKR